MLIHYIHYLCIFGYTGYTKGKKAQNKDNKTHKVPGNGNSGVKACRDLSALLPRFYSKASIPPGVTIETNKSIGNSLPTGLKVKQEESTK